MNIGFKNGAGDGVNVGRLFSNKSNEIPPGFNSPSYMDTKSMMRYGK